MRKVKYNANERIENIVVEKIFIKGNIYLKSPLIIGSGIDENSDDDIQRDSMGNPFIPGTTLAGVFKEYVCNNYNEKIGRKLFGAKEDVNEKGKDGRKLDDDNKLSKLIIYDGYFDEDYIINIRDGVELDENRQTVDKSKYDYEIIEPCTFFKLRMEINIRENDLNYEEKYKEAVDFILQVLIQGKIFIGGKVSRGFGRVYLKEDSLKCMKINLKLKENLNRLFDFNWESKCFEDYDELKAIDIKDQFTEVKVNIRVPNSVIIRRYSGDPEDVDYENIKSYYGYDETVPVIPGTTWAGVFIHHTKKILREILESSYKELSREIKDEIIKRFVDDLYFEGIINREDGKQIRARSKIFFEESVIYNSITIPQTRVKIDRFTGGSFESALYDSKAEYSGHSQLNIKILETDEENKDVILGMVLLVLRDLDIGIVAVGGETSIGRGILKIDGEIKINGLNDYDINKYYTALARKVERLKEEIDNE